MSYIVNGMVRGRENRVSGSPAGRENMQGANPPPLQPKETRFLGTSTAITSITYTGNVATLTLTAHGLIPGDVIRIAGADQSDYNGDKLVQTVPTSATLTYDIYSSQATTATGTLTFQKHQK